MNAGGFPRTVKDFSLFKQAFQFAESRTADNLGQISLISRKDFAERETFVFQTQVPGFEYASLLIEHALLLRTHREGRIYVGLEKLSAMQPIIDRYLRIADISQSVFIFGEPDWQLPRHPNIRVIPLRPEFELAHECFLIADAVTIKMTVVARDEWRHPNGQSSERLFRAVKTSNPEAVAELAAAAEGVIDWSIAA